MPSLEKSQVKVATIHEVGCSVDDLLEGANHRQHQAKGAAHALRAHAKNIQALITAADNDLEQGIPDDETLEHVKKWLLRAYHATTNFADHWSNLEQQAIGEINALKRAVEVVSKLHKVEDLKLQRIVQGLQEDDLAEEDDEISQTGAATPRGRPVGVRPGKTIKEIRQAEEVAAKGNGEKDIDSMNEEELEAYLLSGE